MSTKKSNTASTNWFLQRVTGVGLVVLLGFHFAVEHFIVGAAEVNADNTVERITHGLIEGDHVLGQITINLPAFLYQAIAVLLLGFSVYHGMYGVYNIAMEQDTLRSYRKLIKYSFIVFSVVLFVQGILIFLAFFEPFWQVYDPR
jgi:succinate dehydrogenase hydrophobic anchor subunit